jgi:glycosyltransferase involved in cell wall biosynthesis
MKILITSLPDLKRIFVQRPHHLISYLSRNHDVTVECVKAWWLEEKRDDYLSAMIKYIHFSYTTDMKIPAIGQELLSFSGGSATLGNSFLSKFDVHISFNSLITGYARTKKMITLNIPTIFDVCDDLVEWINLSPQVPSIFKPVGRILARRLLDKMVEKSSRITYTSKSLLMPEWVENAKKFTLVPNGVDTNMFKPVSSNSLKTKLGIQEKDIVIGFVGALQEWVNLETVFITMGKIAKEFDNYKILIVGSGHKLEENKKLAQKYQCKDITLFSGYVPYELIPANINCMDICILPFTQGMVSQGALPLKLLEYMSCEKPVVSTPLSGVKEAVGNNVLYATTAEDYKQAILQLASEPGIRRQMGQQGRQLVQQKYSWDQLCREFERVLLEEVKSTVNN